ncbi:hypothetical protein [Corynebacterium sp.]|uniref:DUF6918 family protein n=1 Tax=Corynebacterium sp. TaxID=1720 RepID=UPI0026DC1BA0|nr:hypothetical protein [Corynebacterium sp.]MDO5032184.1 hypothetical protein [Corynebacterium sp.]
MSSLSQLLEPTRRPAVVADLRVAAEQAVSSQSGITGMALKGAVAAATKIDAEIIAKALHRMLPEILNELESYWQEFEATEPTDFGAFLAGRGTEVTESLMKVADRNAEQVNNAALSKTYSTLRGKASKVVEPQIPKLGRILQKHM